VADLKPLYLITGTDRPKVELARARLRGHFPDDAVTLVDAETDSPEDAVAACNALGLFSSGGHLVLVDRVDSWKAEAAAVIAAYAKEPAPATTLALVGDAIKKDSPLAKACAKAGGDVLLYDVVKKKLNEWVATQFKVAGGSAERDACRLLVELVGDDLHALALEVDKLCRWADGDTLTERDVETLVVASANTPPWSLTDAWGRRDVGAVLKAVEDILERSADSRTGIFLRLSGTMSGHIGLVRSCKRLEAEGLSPQAAADRLGKRSAFPVQKAYGHAREFSEEELGRAVVRIAQLDHALKGGSRLSGELELERALVDVTARAAR
jgi:DNA polymerase-3 subunit delta